MIRSGYLFADVSDEPRMPWRFVVPLHSVPIRTSHLMYQWEDVQWRFPRSKKMRIRQKWAKDRRNWRSVMVPTAAMVGGVLVAHPSIVEKIKRKVLRDGQA